MLEDRKFNVLDSMMGLDLTSRISILEDVIIPSNSEIIVPGRLIDPISKRNTVVLIEPTQQLKEKHDILVAKTVVNPSLGTMPLRFLNPSDEIHTIIRILL